MHLFRNVTNPIMWYLFLFHKLDLVFITSSPWQQWSFCGENISRRIYQRTCLSVLLHAVAAVVELGEGGGELVQVVAERVEQQVVQDLLQDLREAQDALPQLPLLLMIQDDLRGLCCLPQRRLVDVSQTSYGPTGCHTYKQLGST